MIRAGGAVIAPHHLTEAWYSSLAYLREDVLSKYAPMATPSDEVSKVHRSNRRIGWKDMQSITFVATSKWGMGSIPYSGRIFVGTASNRHELILLGNQDGEHIAQKLRAT